MNPGYQGAPPHTSQNMSDSSFQSNIRPNAMPEYHQNWPHSTVKNGPAPHERKQAPSYINYFENQEQMDKNILRYIGKFLHRKATKIPPQPKHSPFYLSNPNVSIIEYCERISKYMNCSIECYIIGIIFINKLDHLGIKINMNNIYLITFTHFMLAVKYHEDSVYPNAYYASIAGIDPSQLKALEVHSLHLFGWDLHVTIDQFQSTMNVLMSTYRPEIIRNLEIFQKGQQYDYNSSKLYSLDDPNAIVPTPIPQERSLSPYKSARQQGNIHKTQQPLSHPQQPPHLPHHPMQQHQLQQQQLQQHHLQQQHLQQQQHQQHPYQQHHQQYHQQNMHPHPQQSYMFPSNPAAIYPSNQQGNQPQHVGFMNPHMMPSNKPPPNPQEEQNEEFVYGGGGGLP